MASRPIEYGGHGRPKCLAVHHGGWRCDRLKSHRGEHIALGELGTVYYRWRGGRSVS